MLRYDQFTRSERDRVWKAIRLASSMQAKKAACNAELAKIRKEHDDSEISLCFYAEPRQSYTGHAQMTCRFYAGSHRHKICVTPWDRFGTTKCPEYNPIKGE